MPWVSWLGFWSVQQCVSIIHCLWEFMHCQDQIYGIIATCFKYLDILVDELDVVQPHP